MKRLFICASLLTLAAACTPMGGDTGTGAGMSADATPNAAMPYVAMAGSSDLYEIESSRLALQRAPSPAVKQFAQMMIDHHTMTTQQVTQAATAAGLTPPPPTLLPPHRELVDRLQPLNEAAFERMYLQQQRTAHRMALALHQNYASNGDTAQLRQVAATAVPVVQGHIDQLRSLPAR
jgi:putative membrane protein